MPVSFSPASHPAETLTSSGIHFDTPQSILAKACPNQFKKSKEILQSSFKTQVEDEIIPRSNGFVDTVTGAYNHHQALVIRPDDVWISILTQFNCLVNGSAEQLRSRFVNHDGRKELIIEANGTRDTVDFGAMAENMTEMMQENIVDPTLREWILPAFSTTTTNDTIVSSMVMMATMKEYFAYTFRLKCGIPHVTLEGEKHDWETILDRLEKLKDYGLHAIAWYHMLCPVISRFVAAFDDPNGTANINFWEKVAHYRSRGSGPKRLMGWITSFCVYDEKGRWMGDPIIDSPNSSGPASLSTSEFFSLYVTTATTTPYLTLDGARYPAIDTASIPCAYAEVDVKLDDNGLHIDTILTAGLVGTQVLSSGEAKLSPKGHKDTVRPVAGWWMFVKSLDVDGEC